MKSKGHIIKPNVANIAHPEMVSQSDIPNYVMFSNTKKETDNTLATIQFTVNNNEIKPPNDLTEEGKEKYIAEKSTIKFIETESKVEHIIKGTKTISNINSSTYYIDEKNAAATTNNIKDCLLKNSFLGSNYDISISLIKEANNTIKMRNEIVLKSLGSGKNYNISEPENNEIITVSNHSNSTNKDSIFNGSANASIELEVYNTNNDSFLGENNFPETSMGTYMTTLRKSYHGQPLWFDLNALMSNKSTFSNDFLRAESWCDAGTATGYRFIARRFDGANREPFYLSDVLYNITGYNRNLESNDLDEYVYDVQRAVQQTLEPKPNEVKHVVKPLTHQPQLTHVQTLITKDEDKIKITSRKGQSQYFNFILSDADHAKAQNNEHLTIGLRYRFYSQSRSMLIIDSKQHAINRKDLNVVNTIKLNIDEQITEYVNREIDKKRIPKQIGFVDVSLYHTVNTTEMVNGKPQPQIIDNESHPMTFRILPECLYEVNDFAFLNALGGWNSFNFGGDKSTDFKASSTSIYKTQTPQHDISSEIEAVYSQDIKEQFSVKTMPIDAQTVEWLKEMSASMAVYELSTNRYVVVDEMNIKPNTKDELFTVEMKYRYSDSFNGRIK